MKNITEKAISHYQSIRYSQFQRIPNESEISNSNVQHKILHFIHTTASLWIKFNQNQFQVTTCDYFYSIPFFSSPHMSLSIPCTIYLNFYYTFRQHLSFKVMQFIEIIIIILRHTVWNARCSTANYCICRTTEGSTQPLTWWCAETQIKLVNLVYFTNKREAW